MLQNKSSKETMDFKTRMKLKMLETNMGYQTPASLPLASSGQNHHTTQPANGVSTVLLPRYMKVCAVGFDDFVGTGDAKANCSIGRQRKLTLRQYRSSGLRGSTTGGGTGEFIANRIPVPGEQCLFAAQ